MSPLDESVAHFPSGRAPSVDVAVLVSLIDGYRHEAKLAVRRHQNPGGQQSGVPHWDGVPLSLCLAIIRDVDHALGPDSDP